MTESRLGKATVALHEARIKVRHARIGATDPLADLNDLLDALDSARVVRETTTVATDLELIDLYREYAKTCSQWLVRAHGHESVLARDGVTPLDSQQTEALRWGMVAAIKEAAGEALSLVGDFEQRYLARRSMAVHHPDLIWCDLDLRGQMAQALLLIGKSQEITDLDTVNHVRRTLRTVVISDRFERMPLDSQGWIWGLYATALHQCGMERGARTAIRRAEALSMADTEQQFDFLVDLLPLTTDCEQWASLMSRIESYATTLDLGPSLSEARIRFVSRLGSLHLASALDLADRFGEPIARKVLSKVVESHHNWLYGSLAPVQDGHAIHLVTAAGRSSSWALTRTVTTSAATKLSLDIMESISVFLAAQNSEDLPSQSINAARKSFSVHLATFLEAQQAAESQHYRLEILGAGAILPLHAASVANDVLAPSLRMSYLHPRYGLDARRLVEHASRLPDLLIVDNYFSRQASWLVRTMKKAWSTESMTGTIMVFSTDDLSGSDLDPNEVVSAISKSSGFIYFGHGLANDLDATEAHLILGPSERLYATRIAAEDFTNTRDCLLIACSSGRPNPFIGGASLAHAMAMAGIECVTSTLWPIEATLGQEYVKRSILQTSATRFETAPFDVWLSALRQDRSRFCAFVVLTP